MSYVTCSKCQAQNSEDALYCIKCGASLSGALRIETQPAAPEPQTFQQPHVDALKREAEKQRQAIQAMMSSGSQGWSNSSPTSSYAALRGIATLCTGLGWVIVGLAGLSALGGLFTMFSRGGFLVGFAGIATSLVVGGFCFIILRVIAESISVLLDIEANTRRVAIILEQRLK